MIPEKVYKLCTSEVTVTSELAKDPKTSPGQIVSKLYHSGTASKTGGPVNTVSNAVSPAKGPHEEHKQRAKVHDNKDLQQAFECGKFGNTKPSELFLQIYHDVLGPLAEDPMAGVVSPPLMASTGVMPLTIFSTVPDILRHYSNVIARAETEVYLATNFWVHSDASTIITNSIKELSRRAGERGKKVVLKVIYDRGNPKQIFDNHQSVSVKEYTGKAVKLPAPEEIPNVDMQVINYHRPMLGTFHCKYMIVDRKIALLNSNNIQDIDNFEMMCHYEGPIVDSFYDMALISWHNKLEPQLPLLQSTAIEQPNAPFAGEENAPKIEGENAPLTTHHDTPFNEGRPGPAQTNVVNGNPVSVEQNVDKSDTQTPPPHFRDNAMLMKNPGPHSSNLAAESQDQTGNPNGTPNQNQPNGDQIHAETNGVDHTNLPEHTSKDPHYDSDIAGEVKRIMASVQPRGSETKVQAVTRHLNTTIQPNTTGDAPPWGPEDEYTPYIPHPAHEPFPIAMVNRKPYGAPTLANVYTPQNEAWLSGLRNAKKTVFIQSPTLNAPPLYDAILNACRRGIEVTCYLTIGYNDAGELLPMQGGTNEMFIHRLYKGLENEHKKNLRVCWYTAKDQTKPINAKYKKRDCHVKIMVIDSHIGIQGNGNQDSQSWYHSQEINAMIDSASVCEQWIEGLRRTQNTHIYGLVSQEDGIWRDKEGKEVEGSIGIDPGHFSWAKGVIGAVKRVQGTGGF